ncbi:O-antigen ligase family protein [Pseudomonas sp. NPDC078700]|uniref:O-antigen ligase family protein n=1 Tax=Pseudomonas sp. NPDC078700 TaxID=3364424 RepID=UPI0037C7BD0C
MIKPGQITGVSIKNQTGRISVLINNKSGLSYFIGFLINLPMLPAILGFDISGVSVIYIISLVLFVIKMMVTPSSVKVSVIGVSLFLGFVISFVLSFSFSDYTDYANYKFAFFFVKCVTLFTVGILASYNIYSFFKGYFHSIVIVATIALAQFYMHSIMSGLGFSISNRLEVGSVNPIWLSRLLTEAFLCILIFSLNRKYLALAFFIGLPSVLLSGSKGPVLALFISLFYRLKNIDKRKLIFFSFMVIALLIIFINSFASSEVQEFFQQRFLRVVPDTVGSDDIANSRSAIWLHSLQLVFSNAALFFQGVGVGNAYLVVFDSPIRFYPHNIFIEILLENGFTSLLLFVTTVTCAFLKARRSYWMPLFIFHVVNALFSGDIIQNEKLFLFIGLAFSSAVYVKRTLNGQIYYVNK